MKPGIFYWTALLSFMPISELRGAIPFAMANDIPWYLAFPFATAVNILIAPVCWIFLSTLHLFLMKLAEKPLFAWYKKLFDFVIERARNKLRSRVEKYGWLGLVVFTAIPLPFTGAWTATLGAWILGFSRKRTMLAVVLGLVIAGIIVTSVVLLGIKTLSIFTKNVQI